MHTHEHDDQATKSYMWQGAVWRSEILGGDPEDDRAVSETGDRAALSALLRAIWTGEATAIPTAPKTPAPSTPAPRSAATTTTTAIEAGDLDETGKARALAKIQTARELGITLPASKADGLLYDVGTAVMASAWASERKAFESLPAGETVLPRVRDAIRAEERETFAFPAWELRMSLNRTKKLLANSR